MQVVFLYVLQIIPQLIVTKRDINRIICSLQPINFQLHIKDHKNRPVITILSNASIPDD